MHLAEDTVPQKSYLPAWLNNNQLKILALLTMLELKGIVKRLPGKRICLKS